MILVAGGTGRLGTVLVRRLVSRGLPVRVLTRDPLRAADLAREHVEVVAGDVRDPASLPPALAGVDIVVSAVHGFAGPGRVSPATVDRDGNAHLIDAAAVAGAEVVLVSIVGAAADAAMEQFRMKYAAEQHLRVSGIPATIVRATAFLELWVELLEGTAARLGRPLVFGGGDNPINFVSVTDVAAVVERCVTDPTTRGATLQIGGPENLTLNELAAALQDMAGRTGSPLHLPRSVLRLMAHTIGNVKPEIGRQVRAALAMDRVELTFDSSDIHRRYPGLPVTPIPRRPMIPSSAAAGA
jgi:uncharacterized protein YbjT (DUF2867 family)